jgi:hypothetical protein
MRVAVLLIALAACTPDVLSETYFCGPDATCPEGQACNGPDNVCVIAAKAEDFSCGDMAIKTEPDDTAAQAHVLNVVCSVPSARVYNCMLDSDAEDWAKLLPGCTGQIKTTVAFPVAFERLAVELWDLDSMTKLGDETDCTTGESGEEARCISSPITQGTNYGIKVRPSGEGNCDGNCPYNRYSLSVQLSTP